MAYGDAGISVDGVRQLRKQLKEAGEQVTELKEAHRKAGEIAARAGRARVPVRTGALQRTVRSSGTDARAVIRAGTKAVPYGNPIHWGWFTRHIKPQPFLSYGAQETQAIWEKFYLDALHDAINKVKGLKR